MSSMSESRQPNNATVAIIGGGIMGISLGYFLSREGVRVEIFEASPVLGGLAGPIILPDGTPIDRFYHAILSSDRHLSQLCADLGISDQLRFKETRMGFFHKGSIHPMNNVVDFLRFPPLGWIDRFRLGLTVVMAQFINDWKKLEGVGVEKWLVRLGGRNTYENIWKPMLKAKFDGGFDNTPATYIWSRLVRTKSTRSGASQKEESGHLIGGYPTLMKAMAEKITAAGGKIHLSTPVQEVVVRDGRTEGIRMGENVLPFNKVIVTLQTPVFQRLIPGAPKEYQEFLAKTDYIGIVCPLLVLERPLTGYWTLNITDESVPFTGVIETTAYIDPVYVGSHHLVYLPKYTAPGSAYQRMTDDEIREIWLTNLKRMFPDFNESQVRYFLIHRERYVEPLHYINQTHLIPEVKTPVENLYLSTTAQIYPALTNGESVSRHASESALVLLNDLLLSPVREDRAN
jgi:protoporphyrinogen oxidase